jgi:hypothetical protein
LSTGLFRLYERKLGAGPFYYRVKPYDFLEAVAVRGLFLSQAPQVTVLYELPTLKR